MWRSSTRSTPTRSRSRPPTSSTTASSSSTKPRSFTECAAETLRVSEGRSRSDGNAARKGPRGFPQPPRQEVLCLLIPRQTQHPRHPRQVVIRPARHRFASIHLSNITTIGTTFPAVSFKKSRLFTPCTPFRLRIVLNSRICKFQWAYLSDERSSSIRLPSRRNPFSVALTLPRTGMR